MIIWDIQTGVTINDIPLQKLGKIAFAGNQRTITLLTEDILWAYHGLIEITFCAYDGFTGMLLCDGTLPLSPQHQLGAHWSHGEFLRFATSSNTDGKHVISICELQPTSTAPLLVVNSFPMPFYPGAFHFSPVTFHASFVVREKVVIINVRDSKILFQAEAVQKPYSPRGYFSPDGRFFACEMEEQEIIVWKNTPAGYVTWSTLRPRLPFKGFSFSAVGTSIMSWGPEGTQLSDHDNCLSPPPFDKIGPDYRHRKHLVAHTEDKTHIVTARQEGSVVMIFDTLSGTPQQFVDANMQIRDLRIVDDIIYMTDAHWLAIWHLEAGGIVQNTPNRTTIDLVTHARGGYAEQVALSNDCSQIAFTVGETVLLYDVRAQEISDERTMGDKVMDIQFSPDGRHLCVITIVGIYAEHERPSILCFVGLEMGEDRRFSNMTSRILQDEWSRDRLLRPPHGYCVGSGSEWVEDSEGGKVLWLPPSWRTEHGLGARWSGNFLALVGGHNPMPIIIEFHL